MSLNELAAKCHAANIKWWQNIDTGEPIERNKYELLALAISEVAECLEGERKDLMDDKLPHRKMAEVEMADAKIRLLDFACGFKLNLTESQKPIHIVENKGEALFEIMVAISNIRNLCPKSDLWCSLSLAYIESYCKKWNYDLMGALEEKMKFNSTREDHTHESRRIAGGKQF